MSQWAHRKKSTTVALELSVHGAFQNHQNEGLSDILKFMLDAWYRQTLHRCSPVQGLQALKTALDNSGLAHISHRVTAAPNVSEGEVGDLSWAQYVQD